MTAQLEGAQNPQKAGRSLTCSWVERMKKAWTTAGTADATPYTMDARLDVKAAPASSMPAGRHTCAGRQPCTRAACTQQTPEQAASVDVRQQASSFAYASFQPKYVVSPDAISNRAPPWSRLEVCTCIPCRHNAPRSRTLAPSCEAACLAGAWAHRRTGGGGSRWRRAASRCR